MMSHPVFAFGCPGRSCPDGSGCSEKSSSQEKLHHESISHWSVMLCLNNVVYGTVPMFSGCLFIHAPPPLGQNSFNPDALCYCSSSQLAQLCPLVGPHPCPRISPCLAKSWWHPVSFTLDDVTSSIRLWLSGSELSGWVRLQ